MICAHLWALVAAYVAFAGFVTWGFVRGGAINERNSRRHAEQAERQPVAEGARGGFRKFHIVGDTDA